MANNERHIERRQETEKAETEGQTLSGVKAEQVRINFKIKEGGSTEVKEERQLKKDTIERVKEDNKDVIKREKTGNN